MGENVLYGRMELRLNDAEKRLAKFQSTLAKSMGTMERSTGKAAATMQASLSGMASRVSASILATGASVLALNVIFNQTKAALDEFGKVADAASQSGLDAEFFQSLVYQASLAGVEFDAVSAALNTFSKNAGLAVVGKGKMIAALQKLNPALLENIRNAQSQEERVRLAADAIKAQSTAAGQAALATTLFGDAGAKLAPIFNGGAAAIDATAIKARELGIIIDRDLIARADELGDQFDTASKVMDVNFKAALIEIAPYVVSVTQTVAELARGITLVIDSMRDMENQSNSMLDIKQGTNALERLDVENKILELKGRERDGSISMMDRAELANAQARYDVLRKEDEALTGVIAKRVKAAEASSAAGMPTNGKVTPPLEPLATPGASTRNKAAEDVIRQAEAVKDLIGNLEFERSLVGKSEVEQAKMNALRTAGAAATDDQKKQIEAIIEATSREKAAVEATAASLQLQKDIVSGGMTDIRNAMEDGKITADEWRDVLLNAVNKVADAIQTQLVNAMFSTSNSGGLLSGLFGLFGGNVTGGTSGGMAGNTAGVAAQGTAGAKSMRKAIDPSMLSGLSKIARTPIPSSGISRAHITSEVFVNQDGNWEAKVTSISQREAGKMGQQVKASTIAYTKGKMHDDINAHMSSPRRKGR